MGIWPERVAPPCRRMGLPTAGALRAARLVLALGLGLGLGGCAGDSPLAFLQPKVPDVPKVDSANYLTIGAPEVKRPPTLSPADVDKLQKSLESQSKDNGKALEAAIEKGT